MNTNSDIVTPGKCDWQNVIDLPQPALNFREELLELLALAGIEFDTKSLE
jgi:hypothetical protein